MNTSKQIIVMVALIFLSIIATGAYTYWDPSRGSQANTKQQETDIERGAWLYSQNCRVCHGDSGEGGPASNRTKAAPPLNRADLQGKDPATGAIDPTTKKQQFTFISNTITCGRVGKDMPTWGIVNGGPLSDNQIRQLSLFINEGTGWDEAKNFAINGVPAFGMHGDNGANIHLSSDIDATTTTIPLTDVSVLGLNARIEIDSELMNITAAPDTANKTVTVERGLGTTSPAAHTAGTLVLVPPVPPDANGQTAAITGPACGQNLPAVVATAAPSPASATLTITAQGIAWSTDTLNALPNVPLTISVDNKDQGIAHDWAVFQGADATGTQIAATDIEAGPVTQTLNFGPLPPGSYYYHCDVHPQMSGNLVVGEAGAAPAPAETPAAGAPTAAAETPAAGAPTAAATSTAAP